MPKELKPWLPAGGVNRFQEIKSWKVIAKEKGIELLDLSIGQPTGAPPMAAREACCRAVMSEMMSMHEYQDNGSPGNPGFAQRFVQAHVKANLSDRDLGYLPIPGIKPMIPLLALACGKKPVAGMTNPGYDVIATWCGEGYINCEYTALNTNPENRFIVSPAEIPPGTKLLYLNYPHNPSGACISEVEMWELCRYCEDNGIRIANDGAYAILAEKGTTLTDVAIHFPNLSWLEMFSSSKATNFTGWRIGAMVGSKDTIDDVAKIKGNADSGFFAPASAGVEAAFIISLCEIHEIRDIYQKRREILIEALTGLGMEIACDPGAGFFTLWETPKTAFGQQVESAKHFNQLMIANTGIVGVHFHPYIRYAVVGDVESMLPFIKAGFKAAFSEQMKLL